MTGIFPGRFQPFHIGQLMVVKGMVKANPNTVIVICCPDGEDQLFSADEVREMISAALLEAEIHDATIVQVNDCATDEEWADKVLEAAGWPAEATIWSGDESVRGIFEKMEIKTQKISLVPGFNGEEIRGMIREKNDEWRSKIPAGAMDVIFKKMNDES